MLHEGTRTQRHRKRGLNGFIIRFAFTMQGITTAAILGIRLMIAIIPILASAVVIRTLQCYPLHGDKLKKLQAKIASMRVG